MKQQKPLEINDWDGQRKKESEENKKNLELSEES